MRAQAMTSDNSAKNQNARLRDRPRAWLLSGFAALACAIGIQFLIAPPLPGWAIRSGGGFLALFSAFCFGSALWANLLSRTTRPRSHVANLSWRLMVSLHMAFIVIAMAFFLAIVFSPLPNRLGA